MVTSDVPKPTAQPTPVVVNRHSLQWQFQHRFDTLSPDKEADILVPGIPVRAQVTSPFDIRSGAFHGVRSTNGYSAARVTVSIPCGVRHFVQATGFNEVTRSAGDVDQETGYIYIGGWGAGPRGVAVDAGLQKSSAQAVDDEYAFYFKYARNKPITSARFPCGGPDVTLELYPLSDRLLVFSATGVLEGGQRSTITIVQKTIPDDGWVPDGGGTQDGIILKRIVAIAQPDSWRSSVPAGLRRFSSGTYFGVDNVSNSNPRIVWKTCQIGRFLATEKRPAFQPWTKGQTWTNTVPGMYLNWPPADIFSRSGPYCDAVGIALRP